MKRKTFVLWKRILTRGGIILAFILFFYAYFFTGVFSLREYVLIGADDIQTEIITKKVKALEEKKVLWFLPGNSFFTYHRNDIRDIIFEVLPNTRSVSIYPSSLNTLRIAVTAYQPFFKKDERHAITEDGIVYTEIKELRDIPRLEFASSSQLTTPLLQSVAQLYPKITQSLFPVTKIIVNTDYDITLRNEEINSEVRYTYGQNVDTIWSNIVSAIDTEPLKSKLISDKNSLKYLDVRFGNKVFYKFTNGSETSIINNQNEITSTSTQSVQ